MTFERADYMLFARASSSAVISVGTVRPIIIVQLGLVVCFLTKMWQNAHIHQQAYQSWEMIVTIPNG
jgi:hypothetical protein